MNGPTALRLISLLDGISLLILLGIAMPLKYAADMPMAVRIVGSVHGGIFIALCLLLLIALRWPRWQLRHSLAVGIAAVIPCLPFWLDRRIQQWSSPEAVAERS